MNAGKELVYNRGWKRKRRIEECIRDTPNRVWRIVLVCTCRPEWEEYIN